MYYYFFFLKLFVEKSLKSVKLLPLTIKLINPIQKYPRINESYACIVKIFFVILDPFVLSLPINFLISFRICSTPRLSK